MTEIVFGSTRRPRSRRRNCAPGALKLLAVGVGEHTPIEVHERVGEIARRLAQLEPPAHEWTWSGLPAVADVHAPGSSAGLGEAAKRSPRRLMLQQVSAHAGDVPVEADGARRHLNYGGLSAPERNRPRRCRPGTAPRTRHARRRRGTPPPARVGPLEKRIVNFPRRQQYRRLGRAMATMLGALVAAGSLRW